MYLHTCAINISTGHTGCQYHSKIRRKIGWRLHLLKRTARTKFRTHIWHSILVGKNGFVCFMFLLEPTNTFDSLAQKKVYAMMKELKYVTVTCSTSCKLTTEAIHFIFGRLFASTCYNKGLFPQHILWLAAASGGWMTSKQTFQGPSLSSSSRNWKYILLLVNWRGRYRLIQVYKTKYCSKTTVIQCVI